MIISIWSLLILAFSANAKVKLFFLPSDSLQLRTLALKILQIDKSARTAEETTSLAVKNDFSHGKALQVAEKYAVQHANQILLARKRRFFKKLFKKLK